MNKLQWHDDYSVGDEVIDGHHKTLFRIYNILHDIVINGSKIGTFVGVVGDLVCYSEYHFRAEEQLMKDNNYCNIELHIAEHRCFTGKVTYLNDNFADFNTGMCRDLLVYLGSWLKQHVAEEDKKIVA